MRREEREITDRGQIEALLKRAKVCRLAMSNGDQPYLVPLSHGYQGGHLYFHAALKGQKVEMLRRNPRVCFEVDLDCELIEADSPCELGLKYRSVIGFGTARFVEDEGGKREALAVIVRQQSGRDDAWCEDLPALDATLVIAIRIESMTGKQAGYD